jgi:hypothetical protein
MRFCSSWSRVLAPMIGAVTPGRLVTQLRATWLGVTPLFFAMSRATSQRRSHRVPGQPQPASDLLDRNALSPMQTTDLSPVLQRDHPPNDGEGVNSNPRRGQGVSLGPRSTRSHRAQSATWADASQSQPYLSQVSQVSVKIDVMALSIARGVRSAFDWASARWSISLDVPAASGSLAGPQWR